VVILSAERYSDIHVIGGWVVRGNNLDSMVERKFSPLQEIRAVLYNIA
jgi:hypothetical protein